MGLWGQSVGKLLDASIVFSFDRNGFRRHSRDFDPQDLDVDLSGQTCLITGANSGLGYATAQALASRGASTWLLCRSASRGEAAAARLRAQTGHEDIHLAIVDLSDLDSVRRFVEGFEAPTVHRLINNAGILPDERLTSPQGFELTFATNVLGHFLLTELLRGRLAAAGDARVITVSSGGMYTQRLSLTALAGNVVPFDGTTAYAQSKRAQVILNELWAERLAEAGVGCYAMHPGWADTPAVQSSLPRFHRVTRSILRTPDEGADTINWLATCPRTRLRSGAFYFDRRERSTHLRSGTRERPAKRDELWAVCRRACAIDG